MHRDRHLAAEVIGIAKRQDDDSPIAAQARVLKQ